MCRTANTQHRLLLHPASITVTADHYNPVVDNDAQQMAAHAETAISIPCLTPYLPVCWRSLCMDPNMPDCSSIQKWSRKTTRWQYCLPSNNCDNSVKKNNRLQTDWRDTSLLQRQRHQWILQASYVTKFHCSQYKPCGSAPSSSPPFLSPSRWVSWLQHRKKTLSFHDWHTVPVQGWMRPPNYSNWPSFFRRPFF